MVTYPSNITLSTAQREHLARLLEARRQAEQLISAFTSYLYAEYNLNPAEYPTIDAQLGFVRVTVHVDSDKDKET